MGNKRDIRGCRGDFPLIVNTKIYGRELCYLDSAATAQKPQQVIDCINHLHCSMNSNVHRGIHYLSEETTSLYEGARAKVAKFLGASSVKEIVFTAGATASLNTAAHSLSQLLLREGDNVVVSEMEHHSNIVPWQLMCQRYGAELRAIPIQQDGCLGDYSELIDSRTKIVAITQASNVLGTRPALRPLIDFAHQNGAVVVVDGCQGVVHKQQNMKELGADIYAFSGHKLYAPTGIGVMYGKEELLERMPPFLGGGDMIKSVSLTKGTTWADLPLKFEAGTSNYLGAIGLGTAIDYLGEFDLDELAEYETSLYLDFVERLTSRVQGVKVYGTALDKSPVCSFNLEGISSYDLAAIVDKLGVAVRSGQLCAEPTMDFFNTRTMCRASWGMYNTIEDNTQAINAIERAAGMLR